LFDNHFLDPLGLDNLPGFANDLKVEASKPGIAPTNALVLVEWCCLLLSQLSQTVDLWNRCGIDVTTALAQALELCLGSAVRDSVKLRLGCHTPRPSESLLFGNYWRTSIISVVKQLTTKGTSNARNAVLLGGSRSMCTTPQPEPCSRRAQGRLLCVLSTRANWVTSTVPHHLAEGLHDFFVSFTSGEDFKSQIVPALEKALRAPEVVLNDLVISHPFNQQGHRFLGHITKQSSEAVASEHKVHQPSNTERCYECIWSCGISLLQSRAA
jgi:hypothetical protein